MSYLGVIVAVCGLLKVAFKAMGEKRKYVVPDEQAFRTRTIRLRHNNKKKRVSTDEL